MITLKKVTIHKYKCFSETQEFEVEKDITALVGMNEAGKSALLEAIAKTNYFMDDPDYKFDTSLV
jgi:predicted ATP-dependent endonuclease of OLD family